MRNIPRPTLLGYRKNGSPIWQIMGASSDFEIMPELRSRSVDDLGDTMPDELRGKTPDELLHYSQVLDAHLRSIHQDEHTGELRDKTPAEQKAFDYGLKVRDMIIKKIDEHRAVQEVFKRRPKSVEAAMMNLGASRDKTDPYGDIRAMQPAEARNRALHRLDDRGATGHMSEAQKAEVEKQVRKDPDIARRILVTETDAYRSAWMKLVTQPDAGMFLEDDERQAVRRFNEYRAMAEWTTTAGGFGIPVKLAA